MHKDILIVGRGLAGTLLSYFCKLQGKSYLIIDQSSPGEASSIAAGMFTPISGKRMAKSWMAETLIPFATQTYIAIEKLLETKLLHNQQIYQVFSSIKEQNDFAARLDQADFASYLNPHPLPYPHAVEPFGAFEVNQSGWVNLPAMLSGFEQLLLQEDSLENEAFNHQALNIENNQWHYAQYTFGNVAFCEGHQYRHNPYFNFIPYTPTKGEVLTIRCNGLETERIIKKGLYLVSIGNDCYKAGATYDYIHTQHPNPTPQGLDELVEKLRTITNLPFEVIKHESGIRPTAKDRRPIAGEHPQHKNLYILNGLGTKGVMVGPWVAHKLVKNIFDKEPLIPEIRVSRFI
ncbi:MAG: NAD(P)/FAD-dependent oxidoreductase [Bacteroidota bacterium]|jgi:glycine oxidase|nr:FAD-binding oxidoreductase [Sphingobacteriales bacterium]